MTGQDYIDRYMQAINALTTAAGARAINAMNHLSIQTWCHDIRTMPDDVEHARKIAGFLQHLPVTYSKPDEEDTEISARFVLDKTWTLVVSGYRSKSCKIVTKTREIEAVDEHFVPASPARTETYKVMECPEEVEI